MCLRTQYDLHVGRLPKRNAVGWFAREGRAKSDQHLSWMRRLVTYLHRALGKRIRENATILLSQTRKAALKKPATNMVHREDAYPRPLLGLSYLGRPRKWRNCKVPFMSGQAQSGLLYESSTPGGPRRPGPRRVSTRRRGQHWRSGSYGWAAIILLHSMEKSNTPILRTRNSPLLASFVFSR